MPGWPSGFAGATRLERVGGQSNSNPTSLGNAAANTKTSWVALTSSSPIDADGFYVCVLGGQNVFDILLDIGIGAAGSEVVILPNVLFTVGASATGGDAYSSHTFYVPLPIPKGTRIAGRYQGSLGPKECYLLLQLAAGDFYASLRCGRATNYGANTADSGGVSVDPGATVDTKGAWSQLSAAIDRQIRHALICIGGQGNTGRTNYSWYFDIGIGAAASEKVVMPDGYLRGRLGSDDIHPTFFERSLTVKQGQRLAARAQVGTNAADATDRLFDVVVIGFD